MSDSEIIRRLMKEMQGLKDEQARLASMVPQYTILNHDPVERALSTNQNNYAPGDYDHFIIDATGAITISGFDNGDLGRVLFVTTRGTGSVAYPNNSANSDLENRIITISGLTVTHTARQTLMLIYITHTGSSTPRWYQVV